MCGQIEATGVASLGVERLLRMASSAINHDIGEKQKCRQVTGNRNRREHTTASVIATHNYRVILATRCRSL